jgi:xanthine dehydrogenase YagS FAD-binding subunit
MKDFIYYKPKNLKDAARELGKNWTDALPFAGGTDLLGLMKDGIAEPATLVDLKSLPEMSHIGYSPGKGLRIGALAKITDIAEHDIIDKKYPVLAQAAREVASPQLRNLGTIGGNICQRPRCWYFRGDFNCLRKGGDGCFAVDGESKFHCIVGGGPCFIVHPSDTAVALSALNASVTIFSGKRTTQVPISEFFLLPEKEVLRENILKPGEIVTEIRVPDVTADTRSGFLKTKERDVWDFATVSAAVVIRQETGSVKSGKVVLGGVAPKPWIEEQVNRQLTGTSSTPDNLQTIASTALKEAEPLEQNAYKIPLARNLLKRLLIELTK